MIKYTIKLTKKQEQVLNKKFIAWNNPYGVEICHIDFKNYVINDELIETRKELCKLGILEYYKVDDTLHYYRLTGIGNKLYYLINK